MVLQLPMMSDFHQGNLFALFFACFTPQTESFALCRAWSECQGLSSMVYLFCLVCFQNVSNLTTISNVCVSVWTTWEAIRSKLLVVQAASSGLSYCACISIDRRRLLHHTYLNVSKWMCISNINQSAFS